MNFSGGSEANPTCSSTRVTLTSPIIHVVTKSPRATLMHVGPEYQNQERVQDRAPRHRGGEFDQALAGEAVCDVPIGRMHLRRASVAELARDLLGGILERGDFRRLGPFRKKLNRPDH